MEVKRMWDDGQEGEEAAAPLRMLCRQQKAKRVVRIIHSTMSGLLTFALFCTMLHPSHSEYASGTKLPYLSQASLPCSRFPFVCGLLKRSESFININPSQMV
jgi:hypothetical protein